MDKNRNSYLYNIFLNIAFNTVFFFGGGLTHLESNVRLCCLFQPRLRFLIVIKILEYIQEICYISFILHVTMLQ